MCVLVCSKDDTSVLVCSKEDTCVLVCSKEDTYVLVSSKEDTYVLICSKEESCVLVSSKLQGKQQGIYMCTDMLQERYQELPIKKYANCVLHSVGGR